MDTLVLDQAWQPVARISWQRAVTLWFEEKIEVIEAYEDRDIRSVTVSIKMPSVVRFLRSIRRRRKLVKFSRENIYTRDRGRCCYCGSSVPRHEITYDHVVPRSQGGRTEWTNVVTCCYGCNQQKGGRTPEQARMHLLQTPIRPKTLPDTGVTITWTRGMPLSWRTWLRDMKYWNGELEAD